MIDTSKCILICEEFPQTLNGFCGEIHTDMTRLPNVSGKYLYMCGDISRLRSGYLPTDLKPRVIVEESWSYSGTEHIVSRGEVPFLVNGAGVLYHQIFDPTCFHQVCMSHTFQKLTESNKPSNAFRSGIYLGEVAKTPSGLEFPLLRCSSNLSGPTENFKHVDKYIIKVVNEYTTKTFAGAANVNHVLAQVYHNTPIHWFWKLLLAIVIFIQRSVTSSWLNKLSTFLKKKKPKKAGIKAHSDKTKDMPSNGVIAFCSFYSEILGARRVGYDYMYKSASVLTKLRFRAKEAGVQNFTVTLYPNSLFVVPLSTNRLYTHEIVPSMLDPELIPTRMGYICRCSNITATWRECATFVGDDKLHPDYTLEEATELKRLYLEENVGANKVLYPSTFFSFNSGDYLKPKL